MGQGESPFSRFVFIRLAYIMTNPCDGKGTRVLEELSYKASHKKKLTKTQYLLASGTPWGTIGQTKTHTPVVSISDIRPPTQRSALAQQEVIGEAIMSLLLRVGETIKKCVPCIMVLVWNPYHISSLESISLVYNYTITSPHQHFVYQQCWASCLFYL